MQKAGDTLTKVWDMTDLKDDVDEMKVTSVCTLYNRSSKVSSKAEFMREVVFGCNTSVVSAPTRTCK
jgi:hypothetical protein